MHGVFSLRQRTKDLADRFPVNVEQIALPSAAKRRKS